MAAVVSVESAALAERVCSLLLREGVPLVVVGRGSNLLVADRGYDGVVVRILACEPEIIREGGMLDVFAGSHTDDVARCAVELGLTGLEFAAGLPGSLGAAVWGNAGGFGSDMSKVTDSACVLDPGGRVSWWDSAALGFGYRESALQHKPGILLRVRLRLHSADRDQIRRRWEAILQERRSRFPDWRQRANAGCFFRNPPGLHAAVLIERSGARNRSRGGARVWERHAGFIIGERPGCTAADILDLGLQIAQDVRRHFGVDLLPEVRFLGDFGDLLPPRWRAWSCVKIIEPA
ncbi:MAG TPA: UDP-N-acetylmuramate dehydrogenase [Kiritimatiellae bacterium]|nr:UDP-N-acetylmuramate dehydrogenase [Kiritimatiellia bacterium]